MTTSFIACGVFMTDLWSGFEARGEIGRPPPLRLMNANKKKTPLPRCDLTAQIRKKARVEE